MFVGSLVGLVVFPSCRPCETRRVGEVCFYRGGMGDNAEAALVEVVRAAGGFGTCRVLILQVKTQPQSGKLLVPGKVIPVWEAQLSKG